MSRGKLARAAWAAAACLVVIGGARAHAAALPGAADRVLVLVNQARAEAGMQPLALDPQLTNSAQRFSEYMASANFYAHDGPDGSTPLGRIKAAGFPGTGTWGENIAAYYSDADSVMQVWMASPGHRANILNPSFTHIGIGVAVNPNSQWKYYWTEDFGVRAGGDASGAAAGSPVARLPQVLPQTAGQQPVLTGISPTQAAAGATVTLSGRNFGGTPGSVLFGLLAATVLTWKDTQIQVAVPASASTGPVSVQTAQGVSNGMSFTVTSAAGSSPAGAPHALFVAPTAGSAGARVIVHGSGFGTSAGQVLFHGVSGQVAFWYDTLIGVDVPAGASSGSIVVRTKGGDSNPLQFTVEGGDSAAAQPELTYCSPAAGAVGTQVSVLGRNLGNTTGSVSFNGAAATVVNWTPAAVVVIVPQGASSGAVTVQTGGVTSNGVPFTVIPQGQPATTPGGAPAVTPPVTTPSAAPHSPGTPAEGTSTPGSAGTSQPTSGVGSTAQSSRAVWLSYLLNLPQPAPAPQPNSSGSSAHADGGGTAVAAGQEQGSLEGGPVAATMAPAEAAPGATITIQGRQFGAVPGWVRIGRTLAPVLSWTDTTVLARVPPGLGPVDRVSVRIIRRDRRVSEPLYLEVLAGGS